MDIKKNTLWYSIDKFVTPFYIHTRGHRQTSGSDKFLANSKPRYRHKQLNHTLWIPPFSLRRCQPTGLELVRQQAHSLQEERGQGPGWGGHVPGQRRKRKWGRSRLCAGVAHHPAIWRWRAANAENRSYWRNTRFDPSIEQRETSK